MPFKRLHYTMENEKMQKDKLNTDYLLMKKKIVIHKDKHVHKWQTLSPTPRDNCLTVPKSWQGQNTIPDTKGQLFDCPRHQGTTVWLSPTPRDNCLTIPDTKGQLFDCPQITIPDTKGQLFDCPQITCEITVLLLDQWRQSKWGKQSELLTIQ